MKRFAKIILVFVVALGALFLFFASPKGNETLGNLAKPALERNQRNTMRKNDVAKLAAALATYIQDNQGTLPQSIVPDDASTLSICGADCASGNKQTVVLDYYSASASAISFQDYSSDLVVPDAETAFVVLNASCKVGGSGIGASSSGQRNLSLVILYAVEAGQKPEQQCLSPY